MKLTVAGTLLEGHHEEVGDPDGFYYAIGGLVPNQHMKFDGRKVPQYGADEWDGKVLATDVVFLSCRTMAKIVWRFFREAKIIASRQITMPTGLKEIIMGLTLVFLEHVR